MKAFDWREVHLSDPIGASRLSRMGRLRQWFLQPSVAYWMGPLLASVIEAAIIVAVLRS